MSLRPTKEKESRIPETQNRLQRSVSVHQYSSSREVTLTSSLWEVRQGRSPCVLPSSRRTRRHRATRWSRGSEEVEVKTLSQSATSRKSVKTNGLLTAHCVVDRRWTSTLTISIGAVHGTSLLRKGSYLESFRSFAGSTCAYKLFPAGAEATADMEERNEREHGNKFGFVSVIRHTEGSFSKKNQCAHLHLYNFISVLVQHWTPLSNRQSSTISTN